MGCFCLLNIEKMSLERVHTQVYSAFFNEFLWLFDVEAQGLTARFGLMKTYVHCRLGDSSSVIRCQFMVKLFRNEKSPQKQAQETDSVISRYILEDNFSCSIVAAQPQ